MEHTVRRIAVLAAVAIALIRLPANALAAPSSVRPLVVALGDSITYGHGLPDPAKQNYAALYTASIGGKLVNLAVPGYDCGDVLDKEVPQMPAGAAIVILNCGINDVGGFDFTPPDRVTREAALTDAELALHERTFAKLVAQIRSKEPAAKVYLVNLRHWQRIGATEPRQFAKDVDAWNAMLVATHLTVIDLSNDPRMYDSANFLPDEMHPNVAGQKAIASHFTS
jgi:lysophospholipase L1-like esterase